MTFQLTRWCISLSLGLGAGWYLVGYLVLYGLEVLAVELCQIHEDELIVRLVAEEDLHILLSHRLHVGGGLCQLPTTTQGVM